MKKEHITLGILILILIVGGVLRFTHLFTNSIWLDEAVQLFNSSQKTLSDMFHRYTDLTPPLPSLLFFFWLKIFKTPEHMRILSAIFGTAAMLAFYFLARKLTTTPGALFATLLLALSASHVWAAQEARAYSLFVFTTVLSFYALIAWTEVPDRKHLIRYVAATVLLLYTHYYSIFFICAQTIFVSFTFRKNVPYVKQFIAGQLVSGILFLPWLPNFYSVFTRIQHGGIQTPGPAQLVSLITSWTSGTIAALVFAALIAIYLFTEKRDKLLLPLWLIIPVGIPFVYSLTISPFFVPRYVLPASLPLFLMAGCGFSRLRASVKILTICAVIVLAIPPLQTYYSTPKEQWKEAAAAVAEKIQPGDIILFEQGFSRIPFSVYFKKNATSFPLSNINESLKKLPEIIFNHITLWLVTSHSRDPENRVVIALKKEYAMIEEKKFTGISIRRFARPAPKATQPAAPRKTSNTTT